MQWLASICVRRPVFASVLILTLTVVGAFAFTRLGLDRFPKVDFPTVIVITRLPGAAPEEVETEISDKIEEAVNTISGIDELRSTSSEGVSTVIVSFLLEKDADIAAQEVRDRVNRVLPLLPRTIQQPQVEKFDPDAAPVLTLAVSASKPIRDITEYADKTLRRQLESVNGVGQVVVVGGRQRQVNVSLDASRLEAYNLTVTDVSRALQGQNAEVPGGRVEAGPSAMTLRTRGRVQSVQEFGDIVVRQREGHPILLRDVATVEDSMADAVTKANLDGNTTVLLNIRRQSGTNTVQVVESIKERLEDLKGTTPPGYEVRVIRDQSEFIKASISTVEEHLVLGSVLAALVVLVFLWNWRSTLIAAIAIPTSIIATFGLIWYEDFTLNSMTMLALTLAVGIVIDDAIVVLENIYRFVEEKGQTPMQAAVEATREIGLAVMATTLSLVAIFVPVGFMGGIVGRFMKSFGLTMSFAIMVSLLVSFTLTPMLSARWIKVREKRRDAEGREVHEASKDARFFKPIDDGYRRLLSWSLGHRSVVAGLAVLVLLSSIPLFMVAKKNFLPNDDQSEFEVGLRAPEGTSIDSTELIANRISTLIRQYPEVEYTLVSVADDPSQTQNAATVYVRLKPLVQRTRDQFAVMNTVRDTVLPQFAAANLRTGVRPVATIGGGGNQNADIQFTINGPDLRKLEQFGTAIVAAARKQPGVVDVDTSLNVGKPELSVQIDRLKAADLGVQISDAAEALRLLVGGDQVTTYNEGGEQYEVHVRAVGEQRGSAEVIGRLTVPSSRLGSVALENIAKISSATAPSNVDRLNRQRQVTVFAGLLPGASQTPAMDAMSKAAESLNMGPGYTTRFAGRSRELGRAAQNFLIAFVLSLVFMYLILAAQFESWLHPVTILLSLPLTLPFALISIIVTQQSLNIFSALGLLVLFGVVKKNSILQIDHANQLREQGMERDSAILQASHDRLRPILMTTAAFVAGMIPLVLSSGVGSGTNRAIGFVIIGGQSLVLVLSLIVTPVAYSLFDDLASLRFRSLWRVRRAAAATATALLVALALGSGTARAQQPATPGQPAAQAPLPAEVLKVTAADVVRMARENNPDIAAAGYDPRIGAERVAQARSVFLPSVQSAFQRNVQNAPPSSIFFGANGVRTDVWSGNFGVAQRLPFGGNYSVLWNSARTFATSTLSNFNPSVTGQLQGSFSQPLLRDFKIDPLRAQITTAQRSREIADIGVEELATATTSGAERAYWNLVLSNAAVAVQQRSLDLALELERNNRARVDVGQSPPLDLVSARAEVAQRRENLIVAQTQVRQSEDQLRVLMLDPRRADFWSVRIEPADLVPPVGPSPDVDAAVRNALGQRTDLARARKQIQITETNVALAKSEILPDLRVQANYLTNGLGGTEILRTGGFPGTVVGQQPAPYGDVLRQLFAADYPTWTVGFSVSYPLGRSNDQANLARTELEREQAVARLRSSELKIVREVRQAAMQLDQNRQRIETTRLARELSEQRLDAEQKRYDVGMSTNFNVIQAQRDLAVARNAELQAQLDYQLAQINFETVQKVGGATSGSGAGNGGSVTIPSGTTGAAGTPATGSTQTGPGGN